VIVSLFLHPPIYGAYTELFAGLSPEVTVQKSGAWSKFIGRRCGVRSDSAADLSKVVPWGRFLPLRKDFEAASKTEAEGGTGVGLQFWDWTEEQVKPYL
jgi:retinol dehydrogenase 12